MQGIEVEHLTNRENSLYSELFIPEALVKNTSIGSNLLYSFISFDMRKHHWTYSENLPVASGEFSKII